MFSIQYCRKVLRSVSDQYASIGFNVPITICVILLNGINQPGQYHLVVNTVYRLPKFCDFVWVVV